MRLYNRRRGGQRLNDLIAAHDVACVAYYPEQWRLRYGLGLEAQNQASLDAGIRHHAGKTAAEWVAAAERRCRSTA